MFSLWFLEDPSTSPPNPYPRFFFMACLWFPWSFIKLMACNISLQHKSKGTFLIIAWIPALKEIPGWKFSWEMDLCSFWGLPFNKGKFFKSLSTYTCTHTHLNQNKGKRKGERNGIRAFRIIASTWPSYPFSLSDGRESTILNTAIILLRACLFFRYSQFSFSNLWKIFLLSGIPLLSISH